MDRPPANGARIIWLALTASVGLLATAFWNYANGVQGQIQDARERLITLDNRVVDMAKDVAGLRADLAWQQKSRR